MSKKFKLKNSNHQEREDKYFDGITVGESLYSLIYGKGVVSMVLDDAEDMDGFFAFLVKYPTLKNPKKSVYYTLDGFPNWCSSDAATQTVFYPKDIDFSEMDFEPSEKVPKESKIKKLAEEHNLEIRCPSGAWRNADDCPDSIVKKFIDGAMYHLFRKGKK